MQNPASAFSVCLLPLPYIVVGNVGMKFFRNSVKNRAFISIKKLNLKYFASKLRCNAFWSPF